MIYYSLSQSQLTLSAVVRWCREYETSPVHEASTETVAEHWDAER